MAELFGLFASGLSVAQIAGSVVITSLKMKALLDEVKDVPEILRDMLDHLELLTPILCEVTEDDIEGAGTSPPRLATHSHVQQALQKAFTACQTAGMRRKRAMVKVVLKKGKLAQYEMRLQKTIQLLTLAQNAYIIALQRTQPEKIVSQIMFALAESTQAAHSLEKVPQDQSPSDLEVATKATDYRMSTRKQPVALNENLQLGFAKLTGLVRFYTPSKERNVQTSISKQGQFLRIQVQMPTWLSASVLDTAFSRSYAGWTCSLNVYGNLCSGSVEYQLATDAMRRDDVDAMRRLFQERRCSPLDRLVFGNENKESSLMEYAMFLCAWRTSEYLLNNGAEYDNAFRDVKQKLISLRNDCYLEDFLMHSDLSDTVRTNCLASYPGDLNGFTNLVGRVWPHGEFYEAAFEDKRLDLAMDLIANAKERLHFSPATFHHLCATLSLEEAGSDAAMKILSYLATQLGQIVWEDPNIASEWHSVILETALRLNKALVMPAQHPAGGESYGYNFARLSPTTTPFTNLFLASVIALPGQNGDKKRARQHKIKSRLANCERAVQMALNVLQKCGIDLLEYGKQEKQRLLDQESGCHFRIFRDVWYDRDLDSRITNNGLFEVRLISFEYGCQPEDWKLWWSEPTDELIGDFWKEMEPEPLYIPGSWVEEL